MLTGLLRGYGKSTPALESATDEQYSRSLLWPAQAEPLRPFALSPPSTPLSSPTFRVGHFDDRGGLELNESRDARVIVAQDAFGAMDRPMVLFDSHKQNPTESAPRVTPLTSTAPNSALQSPQKIQPSLFNAQQRNRSTTISGPASAWTRPTRDVENNDRVNRLLDCMFGVTSATKSESSTKMHVLLAGQDQSVSQSQVNPSAFYRAPAPRAPMLRSQTSSHISVTQKTTRAAKDDGAIAEDIILVTRMFTVTLPESKEPVPSISNSFAISMQPDDPPSPAQSTKLEDASTSKKSKLIEKKVPMFAVAIMLQLPPDDQKKNMSRPASRTSLASSSFPNSFSSDLASSWTLLEAIPDSLGSSAHSQRGSDRRIEHVTNVWDVILRSLSDLEKVAHREIERLLVQVDRQMMSSFTKIPKGPHEQRTNQRSIYLRSAFSAAEIRPMDQAARHTLRRICLAVCIPKVVTGIGFAGGHWLDEARHLVQICGMKSQNFFLFNLLTAFLGNHTEWLEKIGFDWCKKQGRLHRSSKQKSRSVASRTVIVAEKRSRARRLIFLLASFLPSPQGINAFEKDNTPLKSPLHTPGLSASSPLHAERGQVMARNIGHRNTPSQHVSFGAADVVGLSTSVSSTESAASKASPKLPRPRFDRKDSDTTSAGAFAQVPACQASIHIRKASSTHAALPATPVAHLSTKRTSYFPGDAIVEGGESAASVDLQRILRGGSSASSGWGSILGGLWTKRNEGSGLTRPLMPSNEFNGPESDSNVSPSRSRQDDDKLQSMVHEAVGVDVPRSHKAGRSATDGSRGAIDHARMSGSVEPPRLRVDAQDGVVDVDVGIPGFFGWEGESGPMSPSKIPGASTSARSFDGASLHTSVSQSLSRGGADSIDNPNVAGYLKRYHEDFSLQAVGWYDGLTEEIKQSMRREPTPVQESVTGPQSSEKEESSGDWINVCSTLVANAQNWSIERLTLRRKKAMRRNSEGEQPVSLEGSGPSRLLKCEEHFVLEPVMEFDVTLTDAIESILDISRSLGSSDGTRSHSRTLSSGTGSTSVSTPPTSSFAAGYFESGHRPPKLRADCRQVVANALVEVVKSVNEDITKQQAGSETSGASLPHSDRGASRHQQDNVLREGVKKWLLNKETREVW